MLFLLFYFVDTMDKVEKVFIVRFTFSLPTSAAVSGQESEHQASVNGNL